MSARLWSLSPEELATQTDRGNGIGGGCDQLKEQPKAQQQAAPPASPPPETPSVPKAEPKQASALPKSDVDCGDFTTQAQAQAYLLPGDPHRLDRDRDGGGMRDPALVRRFVCIAPLGVPQKPTPTCGLRVTDKVMFSET